VEGDQIAELLRRAAPLAEERQRKLIDLEDAIRLDSGARRDAAIARRIELKRDIDFEDGDPAEGLRRLVSYMNGTIATIDEILASLRHV
jgi:hypothetical protein